MTWRDRARPVIARVIQENAGLTERELRKALAAAYISYSYGEKRGHPYRIWCSEINYQLGKRKPGTRGKGEQPQAASSPGQQPLFTENL